jgi:hypothetical protein
MPVAEDHSIDSSQVNAKRFGVSDDRIGLSGIEQKLVLFSLNIDTQPVFCNAAFICGSILNKRYDLHQCSPQA